MPKRRTNTAGTIATLSLLFALAAGCSSDPPTMPTPADFGPAATTMQNVVRDFITDNEALLSLTGLGGTIAAVTSATPQIVPGDLPTLDRRSPVSSIVRLRDAALNRQRPAFSVSAIPSFLLGTTCDWDTPNNNWKPNPAIAGAPPNGIGFLLYTPNAPVNATPQLPLDEIGRTDVVVDAQPSAPLDVAVTADEGTVRTVQFNLQEIAGSLALRNLGNLSDGSQDLQFDQSATLGNLGISSVLSALITGLRTDVAITISDLGDITFSYLIEADGKQFRYDFDVDSQDVISSGTVEVDGESIGSVTGSINSVTLVLDSDLSDANRQALVTIFDEANTLQLAVLDLTILGIDLQFGP